MFGIDLGKLIFAKMKGNHTQMWMWGSLLILAFNCFFLSQFNYWLLSTDTKYLAGTHLICAHTIRHIIQHLLSAILTRAAAN